MSKNLEDLDMDNLSEDEKTYLRDRPWLPQPPGDVPEERRDNDWDEDEHEVVTVLDADGNPIDPEDPDELGAGVDVHGDVDEDGDPVVLDADGNFVSYDWVRMTVTRLKEFCDGWELPKGGNKPELMDRLTEYTAMLAAEQGESEQGEG